MTNRQVLTLLGKYECRNTTQILPDGSWPIVWKKARGMHVWDANGKKYLDLTAAFGVAAAGHSNPAVIRAGQSQMSRLLHAMGDVHPHALKAKLARELSRITFERWCSNSRGKTIFCNSGFEAVEAALKTAKLATGKSGIIAFAGGYHGTGYGTLNVTHRDHFRTPFVSQLKRFGYFAPFPASGGDCLESVMLLVGKELSRNKSGAVLVEPVQVRGGIRIPPPEFLPMLRRLCDEHHALLILDEIYTGFGRTGKWFACDHSGLVPDLICLGKALTGGFPLSACIGRASLMDKAWPASSGEAIHTSTFLGHPVGCAMALAQIHEIRKRKLVQRSARLGRRLLASLQSLQTQTISAKASRVAHNHLELQARGLGLLAGLELFRNGKPATTVALEVMKAMLHDGFVMLPEGEHSNVLGFTPPLIITQAEIEKTTQALSKVLFRPGNALRNQGCA